jgi:hypothetical protein
MRAMSRWAALLAGVIVFLPGCRSKEARYQPPPCPEEYLLPPTDDARFSRPPVYHKGPHDDDPMTPPKPTTGRPRPGSFRGPGARGMGGMGGRPY